MLMVVALFLLQVDEATESLATLDDSSQAAAVVVDGQAENREQARAAALADAYADSAESASLVIDDITYGSGEVAEVGDTVAVHYIGRLTNGQEFDNSFKRGEPIEFTLGAGEVIAGWEEGIAGMQVGGERILVVPPAYGYGNQPVGPIPAGSTLIFAVELIDVRS